MSKQLLGLPAKILAIKVSQQIEIKSLRKYTLQRVVYCNTVPMIKQKHCVKKLAITKMQKMISTQLPVPLILFSMRVKRDIQAKHTHKVKLCVLKSPRTRLHSPTSLLTVSWQCSVLLKVNAGWTEPHQNGRTSSLCRELFSWDISNEQKYTHREEWSYVISSKALGSPRVRRPSPDVHEREA